MLITKKQIRKELYVRYQSYPVEYIENGYTWITNAPFWQWKNRLWCVCHTTEKGTRNLDRAYTFITKGVLSEELLQKQEKPSLDL